MAKKSSKGVKVSLSAVFLVLGALVAIAACFMFFLQPMIFEGSLGGFETTWDKIYFDVTATVPVVGTVIVVSHGAIAPLIGYFIVAAAGLLLLIGAFMKKRGTKLLLAVLGAVLIIVGGFMMLMVKDAWLQANELTDAAEYAKLGMGPIIGVCMAGGALVLDIVGCLVK